MKLSRSVSLYIRIRSGNGSWIYASPAQTSKGHLRPLQAMIAGQPTYCADGVYHLRYRIGGRRVWQAVGNDASLATIAVQKKNLELQASVLGMVLPDAHVVEPSNALSQSPIPQRRVGRVVR